MFRKAIHDFVARVASLDALPPAVAAAIHAHTADRPIEAILTLPSQRYPLWRSTRWRVLPFGWRWTPDRTLAFTPEALVIAEAGAGGTVLARSLPLACVVGLELTVNLLYGCLIVSWAEAGQVRDQDLEFSTVGMRLVSRALADWRAGIPHPAADDAPGISLAELPLKFRNYLRAALLPGEPVRTACFQPEIDPEGGWFRSRLAPNRTVAFTDWHVIVLEDGNVHSGPNYSVITRIFPWRGVRGLDVTPRPDGRDDVILSLGLGDATRDVPLILEEAQAETLRGAFGALAGQSRVVVQA